MAVYAKAMDTGARIVPSPTQSGALTRAAFEYQDKCVALTILDRLLSDSVQSVLIEYATDLVVIPGYGSPEIVSIKNRSAHHSASTGWTPSALKKDAVLLELYRYWCACDRAVTATVFSPAGLQGDANALRRHHHDPQSRHAVEEMLIDHGVPRDDVVEFARALTWPEESLPAAAHIDDVIMMRLVALLERHGRSQESSKAAFSLLCETIARKSTEPPNPQRHHATVAARIRDAPRDLRGRREVASTDALSLILGAADSVPAPGRSRLPSPDPDHVARPARNAEIAAALAPGSDGLRRVVVVAGPTGSGKSVLVVEHARSVPEGTDVFLLDGTSRAALNQSLRNELPGIKLHELALQPHAMVIIDGVTDPAEIEDLLPRRSHAAFLVTSTRSDFDTRVRQVKVQGFTREESISYLRGIWSGLGEQDAWQLAEELEDSPLGLTQAASTAQSMGLSPPAYLEQHRAAPHRFLSLGRVRDHPVSLCAAIALAREQLAVEHPDAAALLDVLGVVGPTAVSAQWLRLPTLIFLPGEITFDPVSVEAHPRAEEISEMLRDDPRRLTALYELSRRHLISAVDGSYRIHAAVADVAVGEIDHLRPLFEVGFGFLAEHLTPLPEQERVPVPMEMSTPIALRLITLASHHGIMGPGLLAAALTFGEWISLIDAERGVEITGIGREWIRRLADAEQIDPHSLLLAEKRYAVAIAQSGRQKDAFALLDGMLHSVAERPRDEDLGVKRLLVDASTRFVEIAMDLGVEELRRSIRVVEALNRAWGGDEQLQLTLDIAELTRAYKTGDLEAMLDLLEPTMQSAHRLGREEHRIAVFGVHLARFVPHLDPIYWGTELARQAQTIQEEQPYAAHALMLDAADSLLNGEDIEAAADLLHDAEVLIGKLVVPPHLLGKRLGIRGRLGFVRVSRNSAVRCDELIAVRDDLHRALEALADNGDALSPHLASILVHLAQIEMMRGQLDNAVHHAEHALEVDLQRFHPDHPEVRWDEDLLNELLRLKAHQSGP